ncbi:MAG: double zinc ribbon domain-containing protein [Gemmatimonadota bacterium]|nr:double zinc ribbon domain-containing protein [Gemmatimonadota bacterium]
MMRLLQAISHYSEGMDVKRDAFIRLLQTAVESVQAFVYPPHCLLCRTPLDETDGLCPVCWETLGVIKEPRCRRCGCPGHSKPCRNCADKDFVFSRMCALTPFSRSVQRMVHMLKYQGQTVVGQTLGRALGRMLDGESVAAARPLVVPVPLHGSRLRERGYNQSVLIARALARVLDLSVEDRVLKRVRATETQTNLDSAERGANVEGAFLGRRTDLVRGHPVLLVDDVVTTGATANACAAALLDAGASEVNVAAVACPYLDEEKPHARAVHTGTDLFI